LIDDNRLCPTSCFLHERRSGYLHEILARVPRRLVIRGIIFQDATPRADTAAAAAASAASDVIPARYLLAYGSGALLLTCYDYQMQGSVAVAGDSPFRGEDLG
jgi:hypothetical protein